MLKAPTPCPECSTLGPCPHRDAARRARSSRAWTSTSRSVLAAWRAEHGDWCPGDDTHRAHACEDLTVDHLDPLATTGGEDTGRYRVLCRSANSRRGAG